LAAGSRIQSHKRLDGAAGRDNSGGTNSGAGQYFIDAASSLSADMMKLNTINSPASETIERELQNDEIIVTGNPLQEDDNTIPEIIVIAANKGGNGGNGGSGEHTKNARPSTLGKHQKGQTRKGKDAGGEKADKNGSRRPQRIRPDGWRGPWPPLRAFPFVIIPKFMLDRCNFPGLPDPSGQCGPPIA
ncbi:hypothetical protein, partial [Sphingomonas prati]